MPAPEDGSVLKKVISFTFDQTNNVDCMTEKATRPSFVPEKLHFSAYEQFKGKLMFKIRIYCDVYTYFFWEYECVKEGDDVIMATNNLFSKI